MARVWQVGELCGASYGRKTLRHRPSGLGYDEGRLGRQFHVPHDLLVARTLLETHHACTLIWWNIHRHTPIRFAFAISPC